MPTRTPVPLSALDVSPVFDGSSPARALRESVDLAERLEALGYQRYWLAEHHNIPNIASCSPPVMIAAIAARTSRIRVGAGGVMLTNHSPLIVAEQFGTLSALYPSRIDLGIGRATGADGSVARALHQSDSEAFPQQLDELLHYLSGPGPDADRAAVRAVSAEDSDLPVWLLGTSGYSAQLAGMLGFAFAFAHHLAPTNAAAAIKLYRNAFRASSQLPEPHAMVAANVVAAESDEHARYLAGPLALTSLLARTRGTHDLHVSPQEAAAREYSAAERAFIDDRLDSHLVGGPETLRQRVEDLIDSTQADELMALGLIHDFADRVSSYEILAQTVGTPTPVTDLSRA
jgi:luciferase family oxidoreductase group 1